MKKLIVFVALLFCMTMSFASVISIGNAESYDEWKKEDFADAENSAFDGLITRGLLVKTSEIEVNAEGNISVAFTYESGANALWLRGVEILDEEGNVLSYDYHDGNAGYTHSNNVYNLLVTANAKRIAYYVDNKGNTNSNGTITITHEKSILNVEGVDTWKPSYWTVAKTIPTEVVELNENFISGYVKTAHTLASLQQGNLNFVFEYEAGQAALRIGGVELLDLDGNVVSSDYHYGLAGINSTDNTYYLLVPQTGKYIIRYYCENHSGANNSNGNIQITKTDAININGENPSTYWANIALGDNIDMSAPFNKIAANEVPQGILALDEAIEPSHVRVIERVVDVDAISSVDIEFNYESGKKALNLAGVDFVDANGVVVASHYKLYDEGSIANTISKYTLCPVLPGTYTMRGFVQLSGEGGTRTVDSKGTITFAAKTGAITVFDNMPLQDVGDWSSETFVTAYNVPEEIASVSKSNVRVMTAIVNVTESAQLLDVNFDWNEGSGRKSLDIVGVDLVDGNGNVIAKDYKYNQYGSNTKTGPLSAKKYTLNVPESGIYLIRYFNGEPLENSGGSSTRSIDSEGDIYFETVSKEFTLSKEDFSHNYYYLKNENGEYLSTSGGAVSLCSDRADATKFYLNDEGNTYSLLSFDQGLYMDFTGTGLAIADMGEKYAFTLGEGFLTSSIIVKCDENYLGSNLTMTNDINADISWTLETVESLSFSISTLRHASLCLPVEVAIPEGVDAYVYNDITYNEDGVTGNLDLVKIKDYIPAGEAVLLYSTAPLTATTSFDFDITNTGAELPAGVQNLFLGTLSKSIIKEEPGMIHMYLTKPADKEVGFYKRKIDNDSDGDGVSDSFILGANKLYFTLTQQQAVSLSRRFSLNFIDGATGIEEVEQEIANGIIYDLRGRAVQNMSAPGIYIVNGKKVLVK